MVEVDVKREVSRNNCLITLFGFVTVCQGCVLLFIIRFVSVNQRESHHTAPDVFITSNRRPETEVQYEVVNTS